MSIGISKTPFTNAWFSGLLFKNQWQGSVLTYSIPSGIAYFSSNYSSLNEWSKWFPLNQSQASQFRNISELFNSYIQLELVEVPDKQTYGDIRIAYTDTMGFGKLGYAYLPTPLFLNGSRPSDVAGDIWLSRQLYNRSDKPGGDLFHVMMHELGHSLGLTHPFESNSPFPSSNPQYDNFRYSVMSYDWHPSHPGAFPITPMLMDIAALQYLYGANLTHSPEDTVYQFNDIINIQTIWDPNGYNTLDFSSLTSGVSVDMNPGTFSSAGSVLTSNNNVQTGKHNLALAFGTKIDALVATNFDDVITGNFLDNYVLLGQGNDIYIYMGGMDSVMGSTDVDTIILPGPVSEWLLNDSHNSEFQHLLQSKSNTNSMIFFNNIDVFELENQRYTIDQFTSHKHDKPFIAQFMNNEDLFSSNILGQKGVILAEEAQLYRIYLGLLDRLPDQLGFNWWMNRYSQDASFDELILGFYNSKEFIQLADTNQDGLISNRELLDHLYVNVLGRDSDVEGYNWWLNTIDSQSVSHSNVIFSFTQSEEFCQMTLQTVGDFLWA